MRFDRFRDQYNQVRPHGAPGQHQPAECFARSVRESPERAPDPEYPRRWERQRARRDGSLKFQGRQPHLSEALAGEAVALIEVEEELWQIWLCDYKVAVLDAVQGKLRGVGSAGRRPAAIQAASAAAKVSTISSDQCVNHQVGLTRVRGEYGSPPSQASLRSPVP